MIRFSLSGIILVFDALHATAELVSAANAVAFGSTFVLAIGTALPEVTRWANRFIAGDADGSSLYANDAVAKSQRSRQS